jgi:predicted permease
VAGGIVGAALAAGGLPLLARQLPPGLVPRSHTIAVDGAALAFALGLSALTGVVFGLLPAWQVLRANVNELLKSAGTRGTSGRFTGRAQAALVVGQIALTLTVLTGAALLARSLLALQRTDPGLDPRGVVAVRIAPGQSRWNDFDELGRYYERLLEELRRTPGVEAVALDSSAPLCGILLRYPFWVQGRPREDGNADEAVFDSASADLLRTLKLPLRRGRFLEERDNLGAPRVCVINQELARRLFPGQDPLGQRIQTVPWLASAYREIVGVVGDARQDNLADPPPPRIYVPYRQSPWFFATLLVRMKGGIAQTAVVQAALRRAEPGLTMMLRTLEENIARTTTQPRLLAWLFGLFGLGALGLSAFGIYASTAFTVSQRGREIGVRMALGASPREILRWVLVRVGRLAAIGVAVGVVGAIMFTQLLRSQLNGLAPTDPWMLAGLAAFLPLVALVASAHPALAAARLSPTQALQQE